MEPKAIFPNWPVDAVRPSARIEGAALAVFELALEQPTGRPTSARQIAEKYGLSERFLTQILQRLRRYGIVETERGAFGGFRLSIDPAELPLGFVFAAAETPFSPGGSSGSSTFSQPLPDAPRVADDSDGESTPKTFGKSAVVDKRRKVAPPDASENDAAQAIRLLFDRIWRDAEAKRQEFLNEIMFSDLIADARPAPQSNFAI